MRKQVHGHLADTCAAANEPNTNSWRQQGYIVWHCTNPGTWQALDMGSNGETIRVVDKQQISLMQKTIMNAGHDMVTVKECRIRYVCYFIMQSRVLLLWSVWYLMFLVLILADWYSTDIACTIGWHQTMFLPFKWHFNHMWLHSFYLLY